MPSKQKVQVHLYRIAPDGVRLYAVFHRCAAKGDYWQPVTGNVESEEPIEKAALREAGEEAGVWADASALSPQLWVHDWEREGKMFAEHVFALKCEGPALTISGEHRAYEWLPYDQALQRLGFDGNRRGLAFAEAYLNSTSDRLI